MIGLASDFRAGTIRLATLSLGKVAFVYGKGRDVANIGGGDGVHRH